MAIGDMWPRDAPL